MPNRVRSYGRNPLAARPDKTMLPVCRGNKPMMARRTVVLPAPLRPTRQVTSPGRTANPTPNSAWESPYHACTCERRIETASGMTLGPDIGIDHARVARDLVVAALTEDPTFREHRDLHRQTFHDLQIVLDQKDATGGGDRLDQGCDRRDVFPGQTRRRLVEQQEFRRDRDRCDDLKQSPATIGQIRGPAFAFVRQPALIEKMPDPCFI